MTAAELLAKEISDKAVTIVVDKIRPTFERMAGEVIKHPHYLVKSARQAEKLFGVSPELLKKILKDYGVPVIKEKAQGGNESNRFLFGDFARALKQYIEDHGGAYRD